MLDHLPERDRPAVKHRLRRRGRATITTARSTSCASLAGELERSHPGAAASLREGMEETLTVTRLGVRGSLKRRSQSTNPCESMIEIVRRTSRNVKRWQSGDMALRWTAAGMLEAERQFRQDHRLPRPRQARRSRSSATSTRRHHRPRPAEEAATLATA